MVYIDVFTGFIILEPLRSTAMKEASNVIRSIFGRFGPPRRIITDGGPEYSSIHKAIDEMTTQWGCSAERVTTAPHTPRATGKAERAIQDVKRLIYKFCSTISSSGNYKQHWAKVLGNVEFGLNTRIHPVNRLSPFQLVFNRIPNAFLTKLSIKIPPHFSIASFLDNALHQLKAWNCISSARDTHYASQCQKLDDKHRISEPLPVGSIVFYSKTPKELKFSPWVGPYVVIGHDEFKNHVIRAISYGVSASEQLDHREGRTYCYTSIRPS